MLGNINQIERNEKGGGGKSTKTVFNNLQCLHEHIVYLSQKSSPSPQPKLGPEVFKIPNNMVHILNLNYRFNVRLAEKIQRQIVSMNK